MIQGDSAEAQATRDVLSNSCGTFFEIEWLKRLSEGMLRLVKAEPKATRIAAVVLDLDVPDCHGLESFDRLFAVAPQIPMLVLCGPDKEAIAKISVQHGAQDYLLRSRADSYSLPKILGSMFERAAYAEALFEEKERAQVTLDSIGDSVITTDTTGRVTYLNAVAEGTTGWTREQAVGRQLKEVLPLIDATTRKTIPSPTALAIRKNATMGLTLNCVMVRRDGLELPIEDCASPIHDRRGSVIGAVIVFHDASSARTLPLRMAYLTQHDNLTSLPNRALLKDRLSQAIALARRHRHKLAVMFLDLDRFKHINDSLGHAIGDRLLQSVAKRLVDCVRHSDTVSRQGGDEFVVLLPEVSHAQDAAICAEKILVALSTPHHVDEHDLHVTASIGIATFPDDGVEAELLMNNADVAMYHAKDGGRSNYQFFKPEMNARAIERQSIENGLRLALEQDQFVLHYQPKMDLASGAMTGMEALVRWRHPQRGLLPPGRFVGIAEDCGIIVPMGRWIQREACRQARAWQDAGLPPLRISVNVSPVELRAKDYVTGVRSALADSGLDPKYLELELTETFLLQDSSSTVAVLRALKELGVTLALDDFGTGYSSLAYLRRFPIDTLKIDQSFVRDLTTNGGDASIVSAVIGMGKSLHLKVVAEGVETADQLKLLQEQECPEGQGYYFSHPLVAHELTPLLGRVAEHIEEPARARPTSRTGTTKAPRARKHSRRYSLS